MVRDEGAVKELGDVGPLLWVEETSGLKGCSLCPPCQEQNVPFWAIGEVSLHDWSLGSKRLCRAFQKISYYKVLYLGVGLEAREDEGPGGGGDVAPEPDGRHDLPQHLLGRLGGGPKGEVAVEHLVAQDAQGPGDVGGWLGRKQGRNRVRIRILKSSKTHLPCQR